MAAQQTTFTVTVGQKTPNGTHTVSMESSDLEGMLQSIREMFLRREAHPRQQREARPATADARPAREPREQRTSAAEARPVREPREARPAAADARPAREADTRPPRPADAEKKPRLPPCPKRLDCSEKTCNLWHPIACKFGEKCNNKEKCKFAHPRK